MALRLRTIFPYTLPGVLALIGWWWFFSRKKDQRNYKQERITASQECVQGGIAPKELDSTEVIHCSRAQAGGGDEEESSVPKSCELHSLSSTELVASLFEASTDCIYKNKTYTEPKAPHEIVCSSQESPDVVLTVTCNTANRFKSHSSHHRDKAVNFEEHITSASISLPHSSHDFKVESEDVVKECMFLDQSSYNISKPELDMQSVAEIYTVHEDIGCSAHAGNDHTHLEIQTSCVENHSIAVAQTQATPVTNEIQECNDKAVGPDDNEIHEILYADKCPQLETLQTGVRQHILEKETCAIERNAHTCDELETLVKVSVLLQCSVPEKTEPESVINSELRLENHTEPCTSQSPVENITQVKENTLKRSKSPALNEEQPEKHHTASVMSLGLESVAADVLSSSCIESAYTELLGEELGTDLLKAFSQSLGKSEQIETPNVHTSFEEVKSGALLGNIEAKMVEQLAINIISQVIVAAKQEILSGTASSTSDISCQVVDGDTDDSLEVQTCASVKSTQFAQGQMVPFSNGHPETSDGSDSTQKEQNQIDVSIEKPNALLQNQMEEEGIITQSVCNEHEPALSPVHRSGDSLEDVNVVIEDSSLSVCTSEDGVGMDDPLQSTRLSSVAVCSYDSLSTSGIELSSGQISMPNKMVKKVKEVEEKSAMYRNGDVKRSSPDVKNEGSWTAEMEGDHSGGSDVNSMDSVDSGCALGKTEQLQNVKQRSEGKKSELVVWEVEVPKHLVGRLIGKQGRFVSFLKESSGAKIYISTLPYTQDFQICHIEGSQQQVDRALSLIGKKFKELNLTNIYAPPPSLTLHSLPMTSWLMLPDGVTVEVLVVSVVNAGHMFVQQHTHPTFHALRSLDQQMYLCYTQPGIPTLPSPVEVGVICAAPAVDNAWWRAQVVAYFKDSEEVEIRYVDYGGYERVKVEILRQIRSDFVTLPFQGAEVLLDNVIPLAEEDHFSSEADTAVNELTRGTALLAQVTNYDGATGLPLIQLWSMMADEVVSINRTLVERGFAQWIDSY